MTVIERLAREVEREITDKEFRDIQILISSFRGSLSDCLMAKYILSKKGKKND